MLGFFFAHVFLVGKMYSTICDEALNCMSDFCHFRHLSSKIDPSLCNTYCYALAGVVDARFFEGLWPQFWI